MQKDREIKKIWAKIADHNLVDQKSTEPILYNKLLSVFNVGDYYYYLLDLPRGIFESVSPEMHKLLGYSITDFTIPFMINKIHPEDISWFLDFESTAVNFLQSLPVNKILKYKIRYDYRLQKADGNYIRILQQVVTLLHSDVGEIIKVLGVHTDITHIKLEGKPVLSFIGLDGEPSYIDVKVKNVFSPSEEFLTSREKEILSFLITGKSSSQISKVLFLSKSTVDTHRRNMLRKTNCKNTGELIATAIKSGFI
jgi:DNA-binding CsgD family transcriptional regulator